ncbi:bifunctional YncE family protein/alkaline phosphatase family protein [Abditibacterium utsteinense]|nr:alkaline phosphatase family protein [Abditibacterium utsteinense]
MRNFNNGSLGQKNTARSANMARKQTLATGILGGAIIALGLTFQAASTAPLPPKSSLAAGGVSSQLVTGKRISPLGTQTSVGSFPANLVISPDGRFVLVTNIGSRTYLSVLRVSDGALVSQLDWNGDSPIFKKKKQALYYGLICGAKNGDSTPIYASRGAEGTVAVLSLDENGSLKDTGRNLGVPSDEKTPQTHLAGLSLSGDGSQIYAANNSADPQKMMRGALQILDVASGKLQSEIELPGYPFAVAIQTRGTNSSKIYVSSEQRGVISVIEARSGKVVREIAVGTQPVGLKFDNSQKRLFVVNAGSDTLSIIDTQTDRVLNTVLLRPDNARGLPGATPLGMTLSRDEKWLYIALGDMNAVAVIDLGRKTLAGYLPVGWYPTALAISPDGTRLFVANAKGVAARNSNAKPVAGLKERPQYIQNIIEGTVSTLDLRGARRDLKALTARVLDNNRGLAHLAAPLVNPGIKHVFYIIKENRTYDQVLGDLPRGNGDPSLVLFGRDVTPNQHALAERFALLDNFYCCAEVSGDGWNWTTGGMSSEYTSRNVVHNYGGRVRPYDFEGTNNGIAVDRLGIPDAARPAGGYLWDLAARSGVSFRNYGFFTDDLKLPRTLPEEGTQGLENSPTKRALLGKSDANYRQFDMTYADSEAWKLHNLDAAPKQMPVYGAFKDPARITAWKREFAQHMKNGNLPALSMIRLPRDHTSGTTAGASSPRAMVADNDFAVGQIVETISRSSVWKSSAIIIVEDDAQNGFDHVDAHRSTAYVISPFVPKSHHDSHFYNSDSALKTIEVLLKMPPMNSYDAIAPPLAVFGKSASNDAPFSAILPAREIIAEVNTKKAYRAVASARILNPLREESAPDEELNDILWHSIKGAQKAPARRYSLHLTSTKNEEKDDD